MAKRSIKTGEEYHREEVFRALHMLMIADDRFGEALIRSWSREEDAANGNPLRLINQAARIHTTIDAQMIRPGSAWMPGLIIGFAL